MKRLFSPGFALLSLWALGACSTTNHAFIGAATETAPPRQLHSNADHPWWGGANSVVTGRMLKTRAELLFAINIWMKQFHQPELTVNDLIVRIADQQIEREPIPRAEYILERIVKNRRFDLPVDLWMNQWENMTLSEQYSSNDRISLPAHYTLAIRVLNVPWDSSLDRDGNQLKVDFTKVPIAYAFSEEKGVVKTKRKPNRKHVTDKRAQMP